MSVWPGFGKPIKCSSILLGLLSCLMPPCLSFSSVPVDRTLDAWQLSTGAKPIAARKMERTRSPRGLMTVIAKAL